MAQPGSDDGVINKLCLRTFKGVVFEKTSLEIGILILKIDQRVLLKYSYKNEFEEDVNSSDPYKTNFTISFFG